MADEYYRAAALNEIPEGRMHYVEVDGEPICLVKADNTVYAFLNTCTHISGPIHEGDFSGHVVTCPWHGSQFDIRNGNVLRGPAKQQLYTYPVKIEDDTVYVALPPAE